MRVFFGVGRDFGRFSPLLAPPNTSTTMSKIEKSCRFASPHYQWMHRRYDDTVAPDKHFVCYTDGSCDNLKAPHVGAYAFVRLHDGVEVETFSRSGVNTTNNRMEMLAIIEAIDHCPDGSVIDVYSDSELSIRVFSYEWACKTNQDLLRLFVASCKRHEAVRLHWIKGHNGDKYNEMADNLAYSAYCEKCNELGVEVNPRH